MAGQKIYRLWKDSGDFVGGTTAQVKKLLGGKGYGLYEMVKAGLNVPPAFCIPTTTCNEFRAITSKSGRVLFLDDLMKQVVDKMDELHAKMGYMPLVSVRSGAPVSMPGMMDTILNVGLNDTDLGWWANRIGERTTLDSYRRLIQMLGTTAYDVKPGVFEFQLAKVKKEAGVTADTELDCHSIKILIERYKAAFLAATSLEFPQEPYDQLRAAIRAVFNSWMNERAIEYRKLNGIPDDMGTAVNVQSMVFGNMGDDSGTGVLFTRDPMTGEAGMMGEFLQNAQGEDVVAGIRTPMDVWDMNAVELQGTCWPDIYTKLVQVCAHLEGFYHDMVDIEFTVQQGELFILQSRVGKRSAQAAVRIAVEQVEEGVIAPEMALRRITRAQVIAMRRPVIAPDFTDKPDHVGIPACPGIVSGVVVTSATAAVNCNEPCILVTTETNPDDIAGMAAAVGILTKVGGTTSHAAVVARAMDKPCVVGCTDLDVKWFEKAMYGYKVSIDGSTGKVWLGKVVPTIDNSGSDHLKTLMRWSLTTKGMASTVDLGSGLDVVVSLLDVWGNTDAAVERLEKVVELYGPDMTRCILDLRAPSDFLGGNDMDLLLAFGAIDDVGFRHGLMNWLKGYGFVNLRMMLGEGWGDISDLTSLEVDGVPKVRLSGKLLCVADLWDKAVEVDTDTINKIFGSNDAFMKVVSLLEKDGHKVTFMGQACHPETALFTAVSP